VRDKAIFLTRRAGDEARVAAFGASIATFVDPAISLSVREREVYDLVCEGLSNAEIAERLFISTSTVKVHVHHVFDKLGIRSRTALALNSARDRYAAPALTNESDSGED
jgi:DNA-binding NarL/FixJ family response regulator